MKWLSLVSAVIFAFLAQVLLKVAGRTSLDGSKQRFVWLGFSLITYALSFLSYYIAMRKMPISLVSPVGTISVTIMAFLAGIIIFGEVANIWRIAGVLLGVLALVLLLKGN